LAIPQLETAVSLSSQKVALERWRLARRNALRDSATEAELYGFFQSFRPDGRGLEDVFAGVVGGHELLQRLLEVYRVTAAGWEPHDAYFLVKAPPALAESEMLRLSQLHRDAMQLVARFAGATELESLLDAARRLSVVARVESTAAAVGANLQVHEAAVDFVANLPGLDSEALLLGEAYYGIACDYLLKFHLLWPLYRRASSLDEPFGSYSQLWKHGLRCDFRTRGVVSVGVAA
jgi:hypothetical protein